MHHPRARDLIEQFGTEPEPRTADAVRLGGATWRPAEGGVDLHGADGQGPPRFLGVGLRRGQHHRSESVGRRGRSKQRFVPGVHGGHRGDGTERLLGEEGAGVVVALVGLLAGTATGWALSNVLVKVLNGVFDPPPSTLAVPWTYLLVLLSVSAVATASAALAALAMRVSTRILVFVDSIKPWDRPCSKAESIAGVCGSCGRADEGGYPAALRPGEPAVRGRPCRPGP